MIRPPDKVFRVTCIKCKLKGPTALSWNMLLHKLFERDWTQTKDGWKCSGCSKLKPFIKKAIP